MVKKKKKKKTRTFENCVLIQVEGATALIHKFVTKEVNKDKIIQTKNIKKDAVGFDQVRIFPTDLIKPVIGLISAAKMKEILLIKRCFITVRCAFNTVSTQQTFNNLCFRVL